MFCCHYLRLLTLPWGHHKAFWWCYSDRYSCITGKAGSDTGTAQERQSLNSALVFPQSLPFKCELVYYPEKLRQVSLGTSKLCLFLTLKIHTINHFPLI